MAVILVVALGIIAYQVFYPHKTPDKSASFAQTRSTKVSKSTSSKSQSSSTTSDSTQESTSASSSSKTSASSSNDSPKSWSTLTGKQQDAVYAQWVNNAQGKLIVSFPNL